ncbi:MAG TPA: hypothetical protein P5081_24600 [Phycisphaerae bacterium]|nr:hypothetical protein [Phycisphaerae bacterium]HRW56068.1 hypothetical protein [Phycisphaerae bacterium]
MFHLTSHFGAVCFVIAGVLLALGADCPSLSPVPVATAGPFNNTTDKTNSGASFIGADACASCHSDYAALHITHGHANAMTAIVGQPPTFPATATRAGVGSPPDGFDWNDVSYLIGGHTKRARFLDLTGFLVTNGTSGVDSQWLLDFPANGTTAGLAAYLTTQATPLPFDFDMIQTYATGPIMQDPNAPTSQENRVGILGEFVEAGVQCEACHGPGSNHPPAPGPRTLFVDSQGTQTCNACHSSPYASTSTTIPAADGYVVPQAQHQELLASGGHSAFSCTFCHDPHVSVAYDRDNAIRNACTACHSDMNMALHSGKILTRGDYSETLSCESCHMSFAVREASSATDAVVGTAGRMGDTRSHIFRINPANATFTTMFSDDMTSVRLDDEGRAAMTIDFVCLRCHNGIGAFSISANVAADIALNMHEATMDP